MFFKESFACEEGLGPLSQGAAQECARMLTMRDKGIVRSPRMHHNVQCSDREQDGMKEV